MIQALLHDDVNIYAVIRPNSKNISRLSVFPQITIVPCDLYEIKSLSLVLPEKIHIFYHLAWEGTRIPYRDDAMIQQKNYQAATMTYRLACSKKCELFIGAGSQAEYGHINGLIAENYLAHPITQYGKYKFKTYCMIEHMGRVDGIKIVWPRFFSLYGKYDYPHTLIMSALENFRQDQDKDMNFTEGLQNWNYLYIKDAARMLCLLREERCESGIYNFASDDNRPLRDYILEMKRIVKSFSKLHFGAIPYGIEGCVSFQPLINKFRRNFPGFCFTNFNAGIHELFYSDR